MTLLRNMLLSVLAFVGAAYGFYAFLIHELPPDQLRERLAAQEKGFSSEEASHEAQDLFDSLPMGNLLGSMFSTDNHAHQQKTENKPIKETPASRWIGQRIDALAKEQGKTLSSQEKGELVATIMELRDMASEEARKAPAADNTAATERSTNWAMMARASQGEIQFRRVLGVGLLEFMKKLGAQNLNQLFSKAEVESLSHMRR